MPLAFTIDRDACQGHGQCVFAAPEVFDLDDDGKSVALVRDIGETLQARVREAAEVCPMQAILTEG